MLTQRDDKFINFFINLPFSIWDDIIAGACSSAVHVYENKGHKSFFQIMNKSRTLYQPQFFWQRWYLNPGILKRNRRDNHSAMLPPLWSKTLA